MGNVSTVPLVPARDIELLLPIFADEKVTAELLYNGPFKAPIAKDQELGTLIITPEGMPSVSVPLYAGQDVAKGGFLVRLRAAANALLGHAGLKLESTS